jgi:DNA-binding transcriptional LysR family regulator
VAIVGVRAACGSGNSDWIMRENLKTLDLLHLSILNLLLQDCSVTKVAEKSGFTQPAVSRMLRRMREVLDDPLLVRGGSSMALTERAAAMRAPLQEILAQVACLEATIAFDPATTERTFNIACADCLAPVFLPRIIGRLTRAGPRIRVRMRLIDPAFDATQALESGSIDIVINNRPMPREDLRTSPLYTDEVVCMMRSDHPLADAKKLTLARYLSAQHLAPQPSSTRELGPVDGELAKAGYRRTIVATVPEFNLVPYVLIDSDLIFTTGRCFAEHYARTMPIAVIRAPSEFQSMRFYQLWHERNHTSVSNRWLRQQVLEVSKSLS